MLPAFASLPQFAARVPGGVPDADEARAQAALEDASSLIRDEAGTTWVDANNALDLPTGTDAWKADTLVRVCCAAARRTFENPDGVSQESLGGYSVAQSNSSSDVYLTAAEKRQVRKAAGFTGLGVLTTTRSPIGTTGITGGLETNRCDALGADSTFLDVDPAGDPIPWAGPDGY